MDPIDVLGRMGGISTTGRLERATSPTRVRRAVAARQVVRLAHGRLALPTVDDALQRAHALTGVLSHLSSAAWWGWALKSQPDVPQVTVPKDRRVVGSRDGVHFADLSADDVHDRTVTTRSRTLVDCLRSLPFDAALAVADSAFREGAEHFDVVAGSVKGPGARRVREVIALANPQAANPFESVLRALAIQAGLSVMPQSRIRHGREWVVPDLVDRSRHLVLEADSFTWHGDRSAMRRDCQRYNWLVRHGWRVLRLTWEDVMLHQSEVLELLRAMR